MKIVRRAAKGGITGLFLILGTGCNSDAGGESSSDNQSTETVATKITGTGTDPGTDAGRSVESESGEYGIYTDYMDAYKNGDDIDYASIPFTARDCSADEVTAEQKKMMHLVNMARQEVRYCGNTEYSAVPVLTWNCKLEDAAWAHTNDMVDNNFFAHAGSDGLHAGVRVDAADYDWRTYGENLAAGFSSEESALKGLLDSEGHCKNIMNGKVSEFGSGRLYTEDTDYISYWTHVFGTEF